MGQFYWAQIKYLNATRKVYTTKVLYEIEPFRYHPALVYASVQIAPWGTSIISKCQPDGTNDVRCFEKKWYTKSSDKYNVLVFR